MTKPMHAVKWIILMKETESLLEFIFFTTFQTNQINCSHFVYWTKKKKKKRKGTFIEKLLERCDRGKKKKTLKATKTK